MSRHPILESFDRSALAKVQDAENQETIEIIKSEAYEAGYTSGWDDAVASDKTSRLQLEAEFERNIQGLAFTFAEAVSHVRAELKNFVAALIDQFFPSIVPELLREHVRAELLRLGEELTEVPVEIVASPDCNPTVAEMLTKDFSMNIQLVEDAALAPGQVYLRLGSREMEIDLDPLMRAVSSQLEAMNSNVDHQGGKNA